MESISSIKALDSTGKVQRTKQPDIRRAKPVAISSYQALVTEIAKVSVLNRNYCHFYRGQNEEYPDSPTCTLFPTILRKRPTKRGLLFENLDTLTKTLVNKKLPFLNQSELKKHPHLVWAILQHYEVCDTPLLDVTQSLHVACSFALTERDGSERSDGIIYVLGLPYPNGSTSYYVDQGMMNVRLLSCCPPEAKRPYFQEGYLIGSFPRPVSAHSSHDFGKRILAKFRLDNEDRKFWSDSHRMIPKTALYPDEPMLDSVINELKQLSNKL